MTAFIPHSLAANPWQTQTARIAEVTAETNGIATYRLRVDGADSDTYRFAPGQFNMLYLPGVGESAISMSGDADVRDGWIHTVRVAGNVTQTLARLGPGETIGLRGPFGTGWPIAQLQGQQVIVVAGGLGMAPLRPLIYHLMRNRDQYDRVNLILGARTPEGLLYPGEYATWRQAGIDVQLTVDRGSGDWTGNIGVVTAILDRLTISRLDLACLVTCGPEVMMKYVAMSGIRRGIPAERIWVSMERNMQCAAGLCGHCQLGPAFICKDGPVLRYDHLQPYMFVESL